MFFKCTGKKLFEGSKCNFFTWGIFGSIIAIVCFWLSFLGIKCLKCHWYPTTPLTTYHENTWAYHLVHITSIISYSRGCCCHFRCGHYSLKPHLCEMQFKEGHQVWLSLQDKAEWHLVFQANWFWNGTHRKAAVGWIYWNVWVCVCVFVRPTSLLVNLHVFK